MKCPVCSSPAYVSIRETTWGPTPYTRCSECGFGGYGDPTEIARRAQHEIDQVDGDLAALRAKLDVRAQRGYNTEWGAVQTSALRVALHWLDKPKEGEQR